jgi:hypothetical protein
MSGNGKVFISHAHGDEAPLRTLLAALKRWGVDHWLDATDMHVGQVFSEHIVRALSERDVFVHLSTPAAQHSAWMEREWWIFWALRVLETQQSGQSHRELINIVFPGSEPDIEMAKYLFIDARDRADPSRALPNIVWLDALRRALSLPPDVNRFHNDDTGYFWWLDHYPHGYVLNPFISLREGAPILHRATCAFIGQTFPRGGVMATAVPKVCAHSREDADRWAMEHTGYLPVGHVACMNGEPAVP